MMSNPYNDNGTDEGISSDFGRLREIERNAVPSFARLAKSPTVSPTHQVWLQSARVAAVAGAVLVSVMVLLVSNGRNSSMDSGNQTAQVWDDSQWALAYEMPTDFLLEAPQYEFAGTTPQFKLLIPSYEILEEMTDEN